MNILLAIEWSLVGIKAAYLLLSLSLLVILHEFGHYLPARWFGCRVEKFFLFFDAGFALVKKKIGDTVYGIGWLPLGGYVKISGMIDESMDKEQMNRPPEKWEFRSKPAWQRLIIMLGGVTVNVIVAIIIYTGLAVAYGETKTPLSSLPGGINITDSFMYELGLQNGDQLVSVDGEPIVYYEYAARKLLVAEREVTVMRAGKAVSIPLPENLLGRLSEKKRTKAMLFEPAVPVAVGQVTPNTPAAAAGLQAQDIVRSVNDTPILILSDLNRALRAHAGDSIWLGIERKGQALRLRTQPRNDGTIGFQTASMKMLADMNLLKVETTHYNLLTAIPAGFRMTGESLSFYIDQFKKILSPKTGAAKGIGGFMSMGSIFPDVWGDWESFWRLTAFLSIVLAFMNILPIPALDGGHVMFLLYEMVLRRKPSEKFMEYAQVAGMVLLLGLMLYANGNDIYKNFFNG